MELIRNRTDSSSLSCPSIAEPASATTGFQGRRLSRVEAPCHLSPAPVALAQDLTPAIVCPEVLHPDLEQLMPRPPRDIADQLEPDPWIKETLQNPQLSLAAYQQEVLRRQQEEDGDREYLCEPLLVTLRNMQRLVHNIQDGQQFGPALSPDDLEAFRTLGTHINDLITRKAPYQRTVQLALMMSCMLEIATVRYALPGLDEHAAALSRGTPWHGSPPSRFPFACRDPEGDSLDLETATLPLSQVVACRWGSLNPGGLDEKTQLFDHWHTGNSQIPRWLNNRQLFLYPTFEPLDPADFCRFGHLPVYPLGMMTGYALSADGSMMTPLQFFSHDAGHISIARTWERLDSEHLLESPRKRLLFRTLVMENLPTVLQGYRLERALELIVFHLFHETVITRARKEMEATSCLPLLHALNLVRREDRSHYPPAWQKTTDLQAWLACLWAHRLYQALCNAPADPPADLAQRLADRLACKEIPALLAHWHFQHQHREALLDHFLARASSRFCSRAGYYKSQSAYASFYPGGELTLTDADQEDQEKDQDFSDNRDLAYLDALHTDRERLALERALQEPLPAGGCF